MSVVVDCRKRNASVLLDDAFCDSLPSLSKRIRLSDAAALLASSLTPPQSPLDLLRARFPDLDVEVIFPSSFALFFFYKKLVQLVSLFVLFYLGREKINSKNSVVAFSSRVKIETLCCGYCLVLENSMVSVFYDYDK